MKKLNLLFLMLLMQMPLMAGEMPLMGDVDGDGKITISDVAELINMLLSGNTVGNSAADVDASGTVSINDVTELIDHLLKGTVIVSSSIDLVTSYTTTADVVCSFSQVPNGADCFVVITKKGSNGELTYRALAARESQTVKVTGLSVNTTYIVSTYITYNHVKYDGDNRMEFTTKIPSGIVNTVDNVTVVSAIANCQFSDIDSGVECGVIVKCSSDTISFVARSVEEAQSLLMTQLTPCRNYNCYAYVRTADYYKEQQRSVSFATIPDIVGAWSCSDQQGDSYGVQTIVLNADGTAVMTHVGGRYFLPHTPINGGWTIRENQTICISFSDVLQTQTSAIYYQESFDGSFDNIYMPTRISGTLIDSRAGWSGNQYDSYGTFVMNRQ